MTDLSTLVPSLKRAVAPPGEYDTLYPASTDAEITGLLADAMAESQLDGFLQSFDLSLTTSNGATTSPDLSPAQQALVVIYAAARHISARLANLKSSTTVKSLYKAGSVEAQNETTEQQASMVLTELLKEHAERKAQLLELSRARGTAAAFGMIDLYVTQSIGDYWNGNYPPGLSAYGLWASGIYGGPVLY